MEIAVVSTWIFVECFVLGEDGSRCMAAEPRIFTVGVVIFVLAVVYYFPTSLIYVRIAPLFSLLCCIPSDPEIQCVRRSWEPRPGVPGDHVEMVGPFSQKWADRIPLVFYQPESETPSPASRPVGPAASFWSVGQALRRHGDNTD